MRECKGCGASFVRGEVRCPYCGTRLIPGEESERRSASSEAHCSRPGTEERDAGAPGWKDSFAGSKTPWGHGSGQGAWMPPVPPFAEPPLNMFRRKSNLVAMALAFALGTFGAHWFYMGNPGRGKWYLLFFWTGIPTIVSIVEGLGFLRRFIIDDLPRLP